MEEENKVSGGLIGGVFTARNIILAVFAVLTAYNTFMTQWTQAKLDKAQKELDTAQSKLEIQSIAIDNFIKKKEFESNLKFKIYDEVKEAVIKKDKQLQDVVVIIVNEMLADDSTFKSKMNKLLLGSPYTDASVKTDIIKTQIAETEFSRMKASMAMMDSTGMHSRRLTIDVFYLEDILQESVPRADKIVDELKKKYPAALVRKRLLPRSVNAQSGYLVSSNQIRFMNSQKVLAAEIQGLITEKKIFQLEQLQLHPVRGNTGSVNYIGIYVRNM
jgi:hypothetical protein